MKTDKKEPTLTEVDDFEDTWTLENALYVLQHPTVDSKTWAEAVEWLMVYGPESIQTLLLSASGHATASCFPDLKTHHYTEDGLPCYEVDKLAEALEISKEEAQEILEKKEKSHGVRHGFTEDDTYKVH